ncbi:MAG TPA: hypothetical protein VKW06_21365 [Candidatus Angelobacter sp.]|nr:hypothetical protein [Candidatus Angelobacter sp.]
MPLLQKSVQLMGKVMPKVASPRVHAAIDYATAAVFLAGAAFFWRRNKRAALAALACGAVQAGVAALTDYPGGVKRLISFPMRKRVDLGLSSMTAAMPQFLAFEDEKEKTFFRTQSLVMAGVAALTEFEERKVA